MKKDKNNDQDGLVYSTNPDAMRPQSAETPQTLAPDKQTLRVKTDKSGRGGKVVTLIAGFVGSEADLEALSKKLKNHCGTGGSTKDGQILIQGEAKDKIIAFLLKEGYTKTKAG